MVTEAEYKKVETIEYEYPDLGPVLIQLQKESAEIYRFILKSEKGGAEYFERLDQLGALRAVHKSAHHSRWEHMVFQMYLTQQLKSNSAFGFSTSVRITKTHFVSSLEELLKSWVLLNNYGHLLDTFEAERVWLELILEKPELSSVLVSAMPDELSKRLATRILREEDVYNFHHLITLALLGRLNEKRASSKTPFDLWIEMTKALLKGATGIYEPQEGSKLDRALNVYHTIRRISYVLLDINSTSLFLRIDSNNLLRNILKNPDIVLYDPESDITKTLESLESLLFPEVYASQQACTFKYHYIQGQKRNFAKIVSRNGINIFCKNHKIFATQLHQSKINNFGKYNPDVKIKHLCRLNLLPLFPFERSTCHFHTEQKNLRSQAGIRNVEFLVTPTAYSQAGSILDVFARAKLDAQELSALYYALTRYVTECYKEWAPDVELPGYAMSNPLQELFSQILSAFIDTKLRLRFPMGVSPRDYHVDIITNETNKANWSRDFLYDIREARLAPARDWELKALQKLLRREKGKLFLIAISNIHLYNPDGTREIEWDGAFFNIEQGNITLYVLEAKRNVSRRSKECSTALVKSLDKAGIRPKQGKCTVIPCEGYAYTKIALRDIALPTLL